MADYETIEMADNPFFLPTPSVPTPELPSIMSTKRVTLTENGEVLSDIAEFYYDIGKRLILGKEEGMEVNRNVGRGVDCLRRAAELGHDVAAWDLECVVGEEGENLRLDFVKAVEIYKRNAAKGHAMALSNLGVCYHKGRGITQDLTQAVSMYQKSVDQHYPRAQYNLAVCYDLGEGVSEDVEKAVALYNLSANGGYAVAQYYMGVCHLNGKGCTKDLKKAVDLWIRAAEQGHAFAQHNLAQIYRDGFIVDRDLARSAHYFISFSRWGDESGYESLLSLLSKSEERPDLLFEEHSVSTDIKMSSHQYFHERALSVEDNFHVPNLYDQCCLHFHKRWARENVQRRKEQQDKLPHEVGERVKYETVHCVRPTCRNYYYGRGRVERRFVLQPEFGGTGSVYDDVVLSFCGLECAQMDLKDMKHCAHHKEFKTQTSSSA